MRTNKKDSVHLTFLTFYASFISIYQWLYLAWHDVKLRYRRSFLGPLWVTVSTAIMIISLGLLWSTLFKTNTEEFMPYFCCGTILWNYFSSQITDSCGGFYQFEGYIKQIALPFPLYVLRVWGRNIIFFLHNFVVYIAVWAFYGFSWKIDFFLILFSIIIFSFVILYISYIVFIICTRFRDIAPIIQSLMQVSYFFTPIIWRIETIPENYRAIVKLNPLYHLFELARSPLLGRSIPTDSFLISALIFFLLIILSTLLYKKYSKKIVFWL